MLNDVKINFSSVATQARLYLCRPSDREAIAELYHISELHLVENYGGIHELSFQIPLNILNEDMERVRNPLVDQMLGDYIVRYEEGTRTEYFIVVNPEYSSDGSRDSISVKCMQQQYEISYKIVRAFKGTYKLYDPLGDEGVLNQTLLKMTDWEVDYVTSELFNLYRTFDSSENNLYEFIVNAIDTYGSFIPVFDTVNKKISVYLDENLQWNEGLRVEYGHYLKSINKTEKFDEVVTRLYVYGNNDLSINEKNPTGESFIENYSFYRHGYQEDGSGHVVSSSKFFSDSLCKAMNDYETQLASKTSVLNGYLSRIEEDKSTIEAKDTQLLALELTLQSLQNQKDVLIGTGGSLSAINGQIVCQEGLITEKQNEISALESNITSVRGQMAALRTELSEESNFTADQIKEKNRFTKHKVWQDTSYTKVDDLYSQGIKNLALWSQPIVVYECDVIDIIGALNVAYDKDKVKLGAVVTIYYPQFDIDIKAKIITIDRNISGNQMSLTIANVKDIKSGFLKIQDLLKRSATTSTTVDMSRGQWNLSADNDTRINQILNSAWDANKNAIEGGSSLQYLLNERGLTISNQSDPMKFLRAVNSTISITADGGNTYKNALTYKGVVAEAVVGKLIAGGELAIENEAGSVKIDADGMTVTDMTLSIVKTVDSKDRSKVEINATDGFKISKNTATSGTPNWIAQISLDTDGNAIFGGILSIGSGNNIIKADPSVGLWVGDSSFASAPYSVSLSGAIKSSNIAITGGSISIGDNFSVSDTGVATMTGANISGNITMTGGSISWGVGGVSKPSYSAGDVGAVANSQTAVFNTLTNNGVLPGLFMNSGQLYINADYIQAGYINANRITGGNLTAINELQVGDVDNLNKKIIMYTSVLGGSMKISLEAGEDAWGTPKLTINTVSLWINGSDDGIRINSSPIATRSWVSANVVAKWG